MSRATHACLTCPGRTRHNDQICAACRRHGIRVVDNAVQVPLHLTLVTPADPASPTVAELDASHSIDLSTYITAMRTWRGTDAPAPAGAAAWSPGRYA